MARPNAARACKEGEPNTSDHFTYRGRQRYKIVRA